MLSNHTNIFSQQVIWSSVSTIRQGHSISHSIQTRHPGSGKCLSPWGTWVTHPTNPPVALSYSSRSSRKISTCTSPFSWSTRAITKKVSWGHSKEIEWGWWKKGWASEQEIKQSNWATGMKGTTWIAGKQTKSTWLGHCGVTIGFDKLDWNTKYRVRCTPSDG